MILRNATMAAEPRMLERMRPQPAPLLQAPVVEERSVTSATVEHGSLLSALVREPEAVSVRQDAALTFEAVAAWLAVQDAETRAACASLLDDELTQVHEAARNEGLVLGRAKGEQEARQALEAVHGLLTEIISKAEVALAQELDRLEEQCVDIVAAVIAKIAGELLTTREASVGAVLQVLRRVKEGRELTIRVCAADREILSDEQARLSAALGGRKFTIVEDARVDLGGCLVESRLGSLDGRLEVQLRELFETLKAVRAANPDA